MPTVRFVKKGGDRLMKLVGRVNPWSKDTFCVRIDCLPCRGRVQILKEAENRTMAKVTGEPSVN